MSDIGKINLFLQQNFPGFMMNDEFRRDSIGGLEKV
jgi:hypothetical protein